MKWNPPSQRVQDILVAPIAIPVALAVAPIILACVPVWWVIDKYEKWLFDKGQHRWFAWRPVKTGDWFDDDRRWVWLEMVTREALTYPNRETIYRLAQGIEAQSATTAGRGPQDESPVSEGNASNINHLPHDRKDSKKGVSRG